LKYQEKYPSLLEALGRVYPLSQDQTDTLAEFPGIHALLKESAAKDVASPEAACDYLLEAAIERFGYSARDVFDAVFDYITLTKRHKEAFDIDYNDLCTAVSDLANNKTSRFTAISHWIVALTPYHKGPFERVTWSLNFKSKWIGRSVVRRLAAAEDREVRMQIGRLQRIQQAKSLAEWFFEPIAHRALTETSASGVWSLIEMTTNSRDPPTFTKAGSVASLGVQFSPAIRRTVNLQSISDLSAPLENDSYYIPEDPGFPLIDSFIIDLDHSRKSAVLWAIQVTTSRLHGASANGYQNIRAIVKILKEKLAGDLPARKAQKVAAEQDMATLRVQVRYLLVVPEGDSSQNLQWHFPNGWSKSCNKDDHRGDVYCLEIPVSVISTTIGVTLNFEFLYSDNIGN